MKNLNLQYSQKYLNSLRNFADSKNVSNPWYSKFETLQMPRYKKLEKLAFIFVFSLLHPLQKEELNSLLKTISPSLLFHSLSFSLSSSLFTSYQTDEHLLTAQTKAAVSKKEINFSYYFPRATIHTHVHTHTHVGSLLFYENVRAKQSNFVNLLQKYCQSVGIRFNRRVSVTT